MPSTPPSVCQHVAELDDNILMAVLLSKNRVVDRYVRKQTPLPKQDRKSKMILQIHMLASIARTNEDYLGKVSYIHIKLAQADVLVFPLAKYIDLCVMVKRPFNTDELTEKVSKVLQTFNHGFVSNGLR